MKKGIGYYILLIFIWPMQLVPLRLHYFVSDILYVFIYHVFGYRRAVVKKNLQNSFPDKSEEELKKIEKKSYHHFVDVFIETLYLAHISTKRHAKRLTYENREIIDEMYEKGKSVICVGAHFGNWEFGIVLPLYIKHRVYFIYKRLNSKVFDLFYKKVREKNGGHVVEMRKTFRQLVSDNKKDIKYFAVFLADQRPIKDEIQLWMPFLNQDTPVIMGPEKIAKKTNAAVIYSEAKCIKRGYYKNVYKLLTDDPCSTNEFDITKMYMHELEKSIKCSPEQWLWTHNRWKFKKEDGTV